MKCRMEGKESLWCLLRACLERRNFTGITQEFHRNQFNFTEKTQEWEKIPHSKQALSRAAANAKTGFKACSLGQQGRIHYAFTDVSFLSEIERSHGRTHDSCSR